MVLEKTGFKLNADSGLIEPIQSRHDQVKFYAMLYWCLHSQDAMIGRAYLQLLGMLDQALPHQSHSQIIFHLIDCLGEKLLRVYGSHFRATALRIRSEYLPRYEDYIASG